MYMWGISEEHIKNALAAQWGMGIFVIMPWVHVQIFFFAGCVDAVGLQELPSSARSRCTQQRSQREGCTILHPFSTGDEHYLSM